MCALAPLRARWRSITLLVLLIAIAGGAALAAAAGARRTTTAIPRLMDYVHASNAYVGAPEEALDQIERLPVVVDAVRGTRLLLLAVDAQGQRLPIDVGNTITEWSEPWPTRRLWAGERRHHANRAAIMERVMDDLLGLP